LQAAQFIGGLVEQAGGLSNLLLDGVQLLAHAALRMTQYQIQIEDAGFDIAQRLAQVVYQAADDLFGSCGCAHCRMLGARSV
jgi:hypothetical protein